MESGEGRYGSGRPAMDSASARYGLAWSSWIPLRAIVGRCCLNGRFEWLNACERAIPFYTGSARFSPGDSSITSDYLANSLGEAVHFLRSAHHGYGIAVAHFSLVDSQTRHLQWTNSLGETLHFSCGKGDLRPCVVPLGTRLQLSPIYATQLKQ